MAVVYYVLVFISGLFFGSFFNLISDRIIKNKSIVFGGSKCDFCKKRLKPKNLIPLLSFVIQRGKCEYCNKKLSFYYPISEILTGLLFLAAAYYSHLFDFYNLNSVIIFFFLTVVFSFYIIMFLSDTKYFIIPDKVIYPAIIFVLVFILLNFLVDVYLVREGILSSSMGAYLVESGFLKNQIFYIFKQFGVVLLSSFCISLFFLFLIFITKGKGMGGGDVKLGFLIGMFNGFPYNILAIFLGFVFGSIISVVLIALKKKTMKDIIPFGPFLIMGSLVTFFFGPELLSWYFNLMN